MSYKALVVEDDPQTLEAITDAMASLEHVFDVAHGQDEAVKRLKTCEYAYMLSAIRIRARSGNGQARIQDTENLLEKMSLMADRTMPPVIIMSDHEAEGLEQSVDLMRLAIAMSRRGAVDVIAKPFPMAGRTLDRVIKKVLSLNGHGAACRPAGSTGTAPAVATAGMTAGDGKRPWLTVTDAATLLQHDLPGLTLRKARSRVSTAASRGEFQAEGCRRARRIEPVSFDAWRLKQRDGDLDAED